MTKPTQKAKPKTVQEIRTPGKTLPVDRRVSLNQEAFLEHYIGDCFGNGTKAYMAARPEVTYETARAEASRALAQPNVQKRLHEMLEDNGLTDATADKGLLFTMMQVEDLPSKMRAISEYNKLKGRYAPEKPDPSIANPMIALMNLVLDRADAENRNPKPREIGQPPPLA